MKKITLGIMKICIIEFVINIILKSINDFAEGLVLCNVSIVSKMLYKMIR